MWVLFDLFKSFHFVCLTKIPLYGGKSKLIKLCSINEITDIRLFANVCLSYKSLHSLRDRNQKRDQHLKKIMTSHAGEERQNSSASTRKPLCILQAN